MPPKRHYLPHTFPHRMVFVISFVLCLCACASIVNAVLAWNNVLWGFYLGTGFWCGAVILLTGMFGIVASFVRNICSVKTYMIISIFGCLASLGMIALAAGGLDSDSGFYDGNNRGILMTHVIHAVYLGLGLLQLTLCVLSDGVCIYYLFMENNADIHRSKDYDSPRKSASSIVRDGKGRSSTGSEVPLVGRNSSKRKQKDDTDNSAARNSGSIGNVENELEEDEPIRFNTTKSLDRQALRRQEHLMSPIRNPYIRSASFSTFGRGGRNDRASLTVHPTEDNASVADTTASYISGDHLDENAYAQIPLFGPPLPIEDDDELPPYEMVDTKFFKRGRRRGLKRPKSEEIQLRSNSARRANAVPVGEKRKLEKRMRNSYNNRSQIPPGRVDKSYEHDTSKHQRLSNVDDKSIGRTSVKRLSRSADLLATDDDVAGEPISNVNYKGHTHGVVSRDFAHSSDMLLLRDEQVPLRHRRSNQTQSLRANRNKRLDRRQKTMSAEMNLNKDKFLAHNQLINDESDFQFDGSNPNVYAGSRMRPTKFSLRRPMRQSGIQQVSAPVPVKPIVSVPSVHGKPPPKPPRTHSVSADDLAREINYDVEVENLFADINEMNDVDDAFSNEPFKVSTNIEPTIETTLHPTQETMAVRIPVTTSVFSKERNDDKVYKDESKTIDSKPIAYVSSTKSVPMSPDVELDTGPVMKFQPKSPDVKLDSGPTLKFIPPKQLPKLLAYSEGKRTDSMTLPTSPILRPPISVQTEPVRNTQDMSVQTNGTLKKLNKTNDNKLIETSKPFDKSRLVMEETNVIYAQVNKAKLPVSTVSLDSPLSPTSPESSTWSTSPTSPLSPTSRMMKARRLLYSFTDKDVNVFDPVSPGSEIEEVAEVKDTFSIKYPVQGPNNITKKPEVYPGAVSVSNNGAISNITVRSPPLSSLEIVHGIIKRDNSNKAVNAVREADKTRDKPNVPEKLASGSAISNITVRSQPLSASDRILQRKTVKSDIMNDYSDTKERPVILQPVMNSPSRHSFGARPKTKFPPLPAPKPANKPVVVQPFGRQADNKRIFNFDIPSPVVTSTVSTSLQPSTASHNSVQSVSSPVISRQVSLPSPLSVTPAVTTPTPASFARSSASTSKPTSIPSATTSPRNVKPDPVMKNNGHLPPPTATNSREVPVNRVQATPVTTMSSNSQGVHHLPQSQYSRQVSDDSPRIVTVRDIPRANVPPPNVNLAQQNDDDPANKPLFSVVL